MDADQWTIESRPVSALLSGQLQLDELVSPDPTLSTRYIPDPPQEQHVQPHQRFHWDRVQGLDVVQKDSTNPTEGTTAALKEAAAVDAVSSIAADAPADSEPTPADTTDPGPVESIRACMQQQGSCLTDTAEAASLIAADTQRDSVEDADVDCTQQQLPPQDAERHAQTTDEQPEAGSEQPQSSEQRPQQLTSSDDQHPQAAQAMQLAGGLSQQPPQQQQPHQKPQQQASSNVTRHQLVLDALRDSYRLAAAEVAAPLNFEKLGEDLQGIATQPAKVAQLLQALHWRLCGTPAGLPRFALITDWVQKDLLLLLPPPTSKRCNTSATSATPTTTSSSSTSPCAAEAAEPAPASCSVKEGSAKQQLQQQAIPGLIAASSHTDCKLQLFRLLRATACSRGGRAYLLQPNGGVLTMLLQELQDAAAVTKALQQHYHQQQKHQATPEKEQQQQPVLCGSIEVESLTLVVDALQKLGLKRRGQTKLIRAGMVPWLVALLAGDTLPKLDPTCSPAAPTAPVSTAPAAGSHSSTGPPASRVGDAAQADTSAAAEHHPAAAAGEAPGADPNSSGNHSSSPSQEQAGGNKQEEEAVDAEAETDGAEADEEEGAPDAASAKEEATAAKPAAPTGKTSSSPAAAQPTTVPSCLDPASPQDLPGQLLRSAAALLLQLVLRRAGAGAAAAAPAVASRLLDAAAVLLEPTHAQLQVHGYVNAMLYALFETRYICRLAAAKGLEGHLQRQQEQATAASLQRQLQHVLARLRKGCTAAAAADGSSSTTAAAASNAKPQQQQQVKDESDDDCRHDDDEDEAVDGLEQLEQQLAASEGWVLSGAGRSDSAATAAATGQGAVDPLGASRELFGEELLQALYALSPADPTNTSLLSTSWQQASMGSAMAASWGPATTAAAAGYTGGGQGAWALPAARWAPERAAGLMTRSCDTAAATEAEAWGAGLRDSGVVACSAAMGQMQRNAHAAAQQTQQALRVLQQSMAAAAPRVGGHGGASALAGWNGSLHSSLDAQQAALAPKPNSRTVHW